MEHFPTAKPEVTAPITICPRMSAFLQNIHKDFTIGQAPGIFPVSGFIGIVRQIQITELMRLAVLHPAEPGKVGFG